MRALAVTAFLFFTISVAQTVGAVVANSEAMMADVISMYVDTLTYFLNMLVEVCDSPRWRLRLELIVPAVSLTALVYFTVQQLRESLSTLREWPQAAGDDVSPSIVFGFAAWGLLFDALSLWAFMRNGDRQVNMKSALMHVGADFLRSGTTLVDSALIAVFPFDSVKMDAWSSIVVSAVILLGAAHTFWEVIHDVISYMNKPHEELDLPLLEG